MPAFLHLFVERPLGTLTLYLGFTLLSWLTLRRWWVVHAVPKAFIATAVFMLIYSMTYSELCCTTWRSWGRFLPMGFLAVTLTLLCLIGPRRPPPRRRLG